MEFNGKRLFIGLELPDHQQQQLARLTTDLPGARWHLPQDLHITLRFLGQTDTESQRAVSQLLENTTATPFSLQICGLGHFKQRILWAGLTHADPLFALNKQLNEDLQALNLNADMHDYHPHITLARIKAGHEQALRDYLQTHRQLNLPSWTVKHLSLFESRLHEQGQYQVLERYPFTD